MIEFESYCDALRQRVARARAEPSPDSQFDLEAIVRILDLYAAASTRAKVENNLLDGWSVNFDIDFPMPNESGIRTLLPGLRAAILHLYGGFATDEEAPGRHLYGVPKD
ncbi:hypothetical protein [Actinacidiphila bryophytorum]|uniref:hypothetical protein n=1 Tax=Actinacidiphila bryophytorum TaxID=1436133 RepID=UPI002176B077|nr:hypothetical protein [Actinacidiphila bryophytorum]UWE11947.1 hypothetical protein NYE86_26795 [Actinacidiphila bryophytorum]